MKQQVYGVCNVCKEEGVLNVVKFIFDIKCACCTPSHVEKVKYCSTCEPTVPERISYISKSGAKINNISTELLLYMNAN